MDTRILLSVPLVALSASCTTSLRLGPDFRSQPGGPVLGASGTAAAGLGGTGAQLTVPVSFSGGSGLRSERDEAAFETGIEWTHADELLGYRAGPRVGVQLGDMSGSYLGFRGGPLLMLTPPRDDTTSFSLNLEGIAAIGLGGDLGGAGMIGFGLTLGADTYPPPFRMPHGRPLRDEEGNPWSGEAKFGRRIPVALGAHLARDDRDCVGIQFAQDALDELASVAAFERLAAELGAAGAPRRLIEGAKRAAHDEARHARQCCALAGAYLGREVSAPRVPDSRPRRGRTPFDLACESWIEGCIGEGAAAERLFAKARRAAHPIERHTLRRIARDEARHAALAWEVSAWGMGWLAPGGSSRRVRFRMIEQLARRGAGA